MTHKFRALLRDIIREALFDDGNFDMNSTTKLPSPEKPRQKLKSWDSSTPDAPQGYRWAEPGEKMEFFLDSSGYIKPLNGTRIADMEYPQRNEQGKWYGFALKNQ